MRLLVHGDDFTFFGYEWELKEVLKEIRDWWDVKLRGVSGDDPGDDKEVKILNRVSSWDGEGLTLKAGSRHVKIILDEFGLEEGYKGLKLPCNKKDEAFVEGDGELLGKAQARRFRGIAARANYMWVRTEHTCSARRRKLAAKWRIQRWRA